MHPAQPAVVVSFVVSFVVANHGRNSYQLLQVLFR